MCTKHWIYTWLHFTKSNSQREMLVFYVAEKREVVVMKFFPLILLVMNVGVYLRKVKKHFSMWGAKELSEKFTGKGYEVDIFQKV